MTLPPVPMIVLRLVATLEISLIIDQAGWAAAFLGGEGRYLTHHEVGAVLTLLACVLGAVVYVVLRAWAGPVNLTLAVLLAVLVALQYALGEQGVVGAHVFLGVLVAMLATALTSWTYRHDPRRVTAGTAGNGTGDSGRRGGPTHDGPDRRDPGPTTR